MLSIKSGKSGLVLINFVVRIRILTTIFPQLKSNLITIWLDLKAQVVLIAFAYHNVQKSRIS